MHAAGEPVRERYGDSPRQVGEWWLPPGPASGLLPTVVLVHGGFRRDEYDLTLEDAVAADLAGRGWLVWNVGYRPSSAPWPAALSDAAAAHDHLRRGCFADRVDLRRTVVVGHSAGGHLALWLASRHRLPVGAPGAGRAAPAPALVVAQAPVAALAQAAVLRLDDGAVQALVGAEPAQVRERVAVADPLALLPTGVPTVCLHSRDDDEVPFALSEVYVAAAGPRARLEPCVGGHFAHLDPASQAVGALHAALDAVRSPAGR